MAKPDNEFERIAQASEDSELRRLGGRLSTRERLLWALLFGVFGPTSLFLEGQRFDDSTEPGGPTSWSG